MDIIIFKLAILLIPGFVSLHIIKTFSGMPLKERRSLTTYDFLLILLFSLFSSAIFDLFTKIPFIRSTTTFSMFEWIVHFDEGSGNPFTVMTFIWLLLINTLLGLFFVLMDYHRLFYKLLSKLKLSNIFGREDIWTDYTGHIVINEWVAIRDFSKNHLYIGSIYMASDSFEPRELVLKDVKVYTLKDECKLLYETKILYLPFMNREFTIEIQGAQEL